ncbi:MAG: hypothetical protein D6725_06435 [Planctomycetota bacterium]|nr:MAG: hypothetical protein D6725_06435 [Planctomycetota bacterium]
MPEYRGEVVLATDVESVFEFLTNPANLTALIPEDTTMRILSAPPTLGAGSVIEFEVDHFGLPQRLAHELTEWEPPRRFVERMIRGPLKSYVHEHVFEELGPQRARVVDVIRFEPPGGLLGRLISSDFLLRSLEEGFAFRYDALRRRFGAG